MHLTKIILDGFKSYAQRTVLEDLDRSFNAITGLNGSGKSNILDAICFVLGISQLAHVRVGSLMELIYKSGQAGITKASVSLYFNNKNKSQSPVGYESEDEICITRTISVGGKNKFLINGKAALVGKVQNLFQSVQLNVNNPNFLIMQGRITKVINMKPRELGDMIEETTGTRMYESKKQAAMKTIEKKEKKLEEINTVVSDEISPTLEKLKTERVRYIEWTKNKEEIEYLSKFVVAWRYFKSEETVETADSQIKKAEEQSDSLRTAVTEANKKTEKLEKEMKELKSKKTSELGEDFKQLEDEVTSLGKTVVKLASIYQDKKDSLEKEVKKYEALKQNMEELKTSIQESSTTKQEKAKREVEEIRKKVESLTQQVANYQKLFEAVSAGIAASTSSGKTLTEALLEAKENASVAETESEKRTLVLNNCQQELKMYSAELAKNEKMKAEAESKLKQMVEELAQTQKQQDALRYDKKKHEEMIQRKQLLEQKIIKLKQELQELSYVYNRFNVNFDSKAVESTKVKGTIANLFQMKDDKAAVALEVTAGARLVDIVVENDEVGKKLVENGKTTQRITVIPLNKVRHQELPQSATKAAKQQDATPAINWIKYDEELEPAMKYVFGQTFICKDIHSAEKVAFHKDVQKKAVSMLGDMFNPSGSLSGGSRVNAADGIPNLKKLENFHAKKKELTDAINELNSIVIPALKKFEELQAQHQKIGQQLELKSHEIELFKSQMQHTKFFQLQEKVKALKKTAEEATEEKQKYMKQKKDNEEKAKDIEAEIKAFESKGSNKEQQMKQVEGMIAKAKKEVADAKQQLKQKEQECEKLILGVDEMKRELQEQEGLLEAAQAKIAALEKEVKAAEKKASDKKGAYQEKQEELEERQKSLHLADKEMSSIEQQKENLRKKQAEAQIELKKLEHKITKIKKDQKDAQLLLEKLAEEHPWIEQEKEFFGKKNSQYDFANSKTKPQHAEEQLKKLKTDQDKLARSVNKKVMSMYEQAEHEYIDLMKKKEQVEKDKSKIEQVIQELDEKKKEAIMKTWQKVNKDFASIFSTLLPGASCKLDPPEGQTVVDGLEIKVAFGGVWKDSLSELSGGQKSLLALSLILALLLFKPAPMYILDEIDAALDPSHTQNIGKMFKAHFKNSQFIVVSLKEGMFQNANVLFRTKFINGQSVVTRTESASFQNAEDDDDGEKENTLPSRSTFNTAGKSVESATTTNPKLKRKRTAM